MGTLSNVQFYKKRNKIYVYPKVTRRKYSNRDPLIGKFVSVNNDIVQIFRDKHDHFMPLVILIGIL